MAGLAGFDMPLVLSRWPFCVASLPFQDSQPITSFLSHTVGLSGMYHMVHTEGGREQVGGTGGYAFLYLLLVTCEIMKGSTLE